MNPSRTKGNSVHNPPKERVLARGKPSTQNSKLQPSKSVTKSIMKVVVPTQSENQNPLKETSSTLKTGSQSSRRHNPSSIRSRTDVQRTVTRNPSQLTVPSISRSKVVKVQKMPITSSSTVKPISENSVNTSTNPGTISKTRPPTTTRPLSTTRPLGIKPPPLTSTRPISKPKSTPITDQSTSQNTRTQFVSKPKSTFTPVTRPTKLHVNTSQSSTKNTISNVKPTLSRTGPSKLVPANPTKPVTKKPLVRPTIPETRTKTVRIPSTPTKTSLATVNHSLKLAKPVTSKPIQPKPQPVGKLKRAPSNQLLKLAVKPRASPSVKKPLPQQTSSKQPVSKVKPDLPSTSQPIDESERVISEIPSLDMNPHKIQVTKASRINTSWNADSDSEQVFRCPDLYIPQNETPLSGSSEELSPPLCGESFLAECTNEGEIFLIQPVEPAQDGEKQEENQEEKHEEKQEEEEMINSPTDSESVIHPLTDSEPQLAPLESNSSGKDTFGSDLDDDSQILIPVHSLDPVLPSSDSKPEPDAIENDFGSKPEVKSEGEMLLENSEILPSKETPSTSEFDSISDSESDLEVDCINDTEILLIRPEEPVHEQEEEIHLPETNQNIDALGTEIETESETESESEFDLSLDESPLKITPLKRLQRLPPLLERKQTHSKVLDSNSDFDGLLPPNLSQCKKNFDSYQERLRFISSEASPGFSNQRRSKQTALESLEHRNQIKQKHDQSLQGLIRASDSFRKKPKSSYYWRLHPEWISDQSQCDPDEYSDSESECSDLNDHYIDEDKDSHELFDDDDNDDSNSSESNSDDEIHENGCMNGSDDESGEDDLVQDERSHDVGKTPTLPKPTWNRIQPISGIDPEKYYRMEISPGWKIQREQVLREYYLEFNRVAFDNLLPLDLPILWNRTVKYSGMCYYGSSSSGIKFVKKITLSRWYNKFDLDMKNVLLHEMCHAASWLALGYHGHGKPWRKYVKKVEKIYPEIAPIDRETGLGWEYPYTCSNPDCGKQFPSHNRSKRTKCSKCSAPVVLPSGWVEPARYARPLNQFAIFVKENYGKIKASQPDNTPHKEIMKILSSQYSETK